MITVVIMFCAAPLFAQSFNTIYYSPNGVYGGTPQSTTFGNRTTTRHYN